MWLIGPLSYMYVVCLLCDVKVSLTFTSLRLVLLWQLVYLFCSSIVINTVIVTAGNFEPYQVRVITVFTVFRLLTDFVCLYTYEFWLSLCKIARSSIIFFITLIYIYMYVVFLLTVSWSWSTYLGLLSFAVCILWDDWSLGASNSQFGV